MHPKRIEDASEALRGSSASAATASNLNDKAFGAVEEWRCRPLACSYPCVFTDGVYLRRSRGGSFENAAVMAAIGANDDGCREAIGAAEGLAESAGCRRGLPSRLKGRGLSGALVLVTARLKYVADGEWGSRRYLGVTLLDE